MAHLYEGSHMRLDEMLCSDKLEDHLVNGHVREQSHPTEPLRILNYTQAAQFERKWDSVTRACRGLIYNYETGEVVARPFPKFFNYGEHEQPVKYDLATHKKVYSDKVVHAKLDLDKPCTVTDKMDGSLGIMYPRIKELFRVGGGVVYDPDYAIATRGSFTSDQALHATEVLKRYSDLWAPDPDLTYLFEIIYPENRIVLDYDNLDDLVLIGAVHIETGGVIGPTALPEWVGPTCETFAAWNLREALALKPRKNAEGVVVRYEDGTMVKIKQEDYVSLHRLIFGLSEKRVWEMLRDGSTVDDICAPLPEEFHGWVKDKALGLQERAKGINSSVRNEHHQILHEISYAGNKRDFARADYAEEANRRVHPGLLFSLLDGRDILPKIWLMIKPQGQGIFNRTPLTEDVA